MTKRKKKNYMEKAIGSQVAITATVQIPYMIAARTPSLGADAMTGALRTMRPVPSMMGVIPTVQISKGLLSELEKIGKKKKRR